MTSPRLEKLRHFIQVVDRLHREHPQTAPMLDAVAPLLGALVRYHDWLPEEDTLPQR
ncbi:cysteine dioxygenase, partial [Klebsiella pneumoniae]|nr:cysteine dioxygenase [Klebsiella pneumoniae]